MMEKIREREKNELKSREIRYFTTRSSPLYIIHLFNKTYVTREASFVRSLVFQIIAMLKKTANVTLDTKARVA